jgi:peroxiredoxin/YHS domain-containing protein
MKSLLAGVCLLMMAAGALAQDTPEDITRKDLPKKATCLVCAANGEGHGEEKPAAGVRYKGKSYFFCNVKEAVTFKQDPEAFMPPVLPRMAPKTIGVKLDGESASISGFQGKVLLVDFWATWCAPCIASMPGLQKLHDKNAGRGFSVVGISIDEEGAKKVKPFLAKRKLTYPILLDADTRSPVWKAFGVHGVPAVFLVDRDGQIVKQWTGKVSHKDVETAVDELLDARASRKQP